MRTIIISALLLFTGLASAQQINGYRYWFDDNTSAATTTTVAATSELVLNTNLPATNLVHGYHRMTLQVRDSNGKWSVPRTTNFVRTSGLVTSYRYWINDDVATLTTSAVTPNATLDVINELAMSNLTRDFNWITLQFKEADGSYSVPYTQAFVRGTGAVDGYEYWIDDAIEDRVTSSITASDMVDLIDDLPANTTWGDHLFTIRFRSINGTWSVPLTTTYTFFTGIEELPGITDLLLFPNPATNQLSLRLTSNASHTLQMEVLDLTGKRVMDLNGWNVNGMDTRQWDISNLVSGTYLLRIIGEKGASNIRFVKL